MHQLFYLSNSRHRRPPALLLSTLSLMANVAHIATPAVTGKGTVIDGPLDMPWTSGVLKGTLVDALVVGESPGSDAHI